MHTYRGGLDLSLKVKSQETHMSQRRFAIEAVRYVVPTIQV